MKTMQKGFTLIELVVVIVILGILAATALPKFVDMSLEAGNAAAAGTAGAVSSGSSINYAKYTAAGGTSSGAVDIKSAAATTTCASLNAFMVGGALPADISWVNSAQVITCAIPAGAGGTNSTSCVLKHAKGTATGTAASAVTAICTS